MAVSREAADTSPLPLVVAPNLTPKISELTRPMSSPRRPDTLDDFKHSDGTALRRPQWMSTPNARYGTSVPRDADEAVSAHPGWVNDMSPLDNADTSDAISRSGHPAWQHARYERPESPDDNYSVAGESARPTWIGDTDSVITDQGRRRWMYDVESDAGESVNHGWIDDTGSVALGSRPPDWMMDRAESETAISEPPNWMGDPEPRIAKYLSENEQTPSVISQRPGWITKGELPLTSLSEEDSHDARREPTGKRPRATGMAFITSIGEGVEVGRSDRRLPGQTDRHRYRTPRREDEHLHNVTLADDDGELSEAPGDRVYRLATEARTESMPDTEVPKY